MNPIRSIFPGTLASSQNLAMKKKAPNGTNKLINPQPVLCLNPFTVTIIQPTKEISEKIRDKRAPIIIYNFKILIMGFKKHNQFRHLIF